MYKTIPASEEDDIDQVARQVLFTNIINQVVDDYVKLAHPATRVKKYLQEHYLNAVDFLFDPQYRLANIENDDAEPMSINEFLRATLDVERDDYIYKLQSYTIEEARKYWEEKRMAPLDHIPDTVYIQGHVFNIEHAYIKKYTVDLDSKTITLDKNDRVVGNIQNFFEAVMTASCLIEDINVKASVIRHLSAVMFETLKVNNCFNDINIAKVDELFTDIKHQV